MTRQYKINPSVKETENRRKENVRAYPAVETQVQTQDLTTLLFPPLLVVYMYRTKVL